MRKKKKKKPRTYSQTNRESLAHHRPSAFLRCKQVCPFTVNARRRPSARSRVCVRRKRERLFLVLEQLVDLGLVHDLDVLQVEPQLLGLFCFLSVHLQDGVVSLLQVLRRGTCTSTAQFYYRGYIYGI